MREATLWWSLNTRWSLGGLAGVMGRHREVWGGGWDSALLTSPQSTPTLLRHPLSSKAMDGWAGERREVILANSPLCARACQVHTCPFLQGACSREPVAGSLPSLRALLQLESVGQTGTSSQAK